MGMRCIPGIRLEVVLSLRLLELTPGLSTCDTGSLGRWQVYACWGWGRVEIQLSERDGMGQNPAHACPALQERGSFLWALFRFIWALLGVPLYRKEHVLKVHPGPDNQNSTGLELYHHQLRVKAFMQGGPCSPSTHSRGGNECREVRKCL